MNLPGIPSLPTDNLYKFIALSLLLFVVTMLGTAIWGVVQMDLLNIEQAAAVFALESADAANAAALSEVTEQMRRGNRTGIDSALASSGEIHDLGRRTADSVKAKLPRLRYMHEDFFILSVGALTLAIVGMFGTGVAFKQWHERHQIYQDRLIVAEAERAELEVARLRAEVSLTKQKTAVEPDVTD